MAMALLASRPIGLGCRYVLAIVFLMAALTKVVALPQFADRLESHSGLPRTLALTAAAVLPWLELTCGVCLALGYAVREAALLLSVLLVGLLAWALWHVGADDCGCFLFHRALPAPPAWWPPVRNALLLLCGARMAFITSPVR